MPPLGALATRPRALLNNFACPKTFFHEGGNLQSVTDVIKVQFLGNGEVDENLSTVAPGLVLSTLARAVRASDNVFIFVVVDV